MTRGGKRKGAGRKPIYRERLVPFDVPIPESWKAYYKKLSKLERRPMAEIIRERLKP